MAPPPHKLELYRLAVQHPEAEAAFLQRVYAHYFPGHVPTRLREDFCGGAAVATHWVSLHENHRALAIDHDAATIRFARGYARKQLGPRGGDLLLLRGDVADFRPPNVPRVHLVTTMNFSALVHHDQVALLNYFRGARRSLLPRGVFVMDLFTDTTPGVRRRRLPPLTPRRSPVTYIWEQRAFNPATQRADCRIHFLLNRERLTDAFVYDWKVWSPPELTGAMRQAGFREAQVWVDRYNLGLAPRRGECVPVRWTRAIERRLAGQDVVLFVVGVR